MQYLLIKSGFIQPKKYWCDISEIICNAVKKVEENNISQQIHISINPTIPLFKLDKGMLEQMLYNLVNNAAIYTSNKCCIMNCLAAS